jgi:chromosome partitioning protein
VAYDNTVVVAQGKGGVGKTSLAANLAGLAAAEAGLRVLVIDLDQQANLRRDLGTERNTGEALLTALITGDRLPVLRDVRPRLDLVPGGPAVADLGGLMYARHQRGGADLTDMIIASIAGMVDDYDFIIIDTPPGERLTVEAAMGAAGFVIIPTAADDGSLDGLELTAERFVNAQVRNPDLQLLGVVLFGVGAQSKAIERETRQIIANVLGDAAPVFNSRIRHQAAAAVDARRRGLLIHELEQQVAATKGQRLARLAGKKPAGGAGTVDLRTRDAKGLTDDYWLLTQEVLTAMSTANAAVAGGTR